MTDSGAAKKNIQLVNAAQGATNWFQLVLLKALTSLQMRLQSELNDAIGVPERTGKLRNSLQVYLTPKGLSVRWSSFSASDPAFDYAHVADIGRGPIDAKDHPLKFIGKSGNTVYRWHVSGYAGTNYSQKASVIIKQWYHEELQKAVDSTPVGA